MKIIKQLWYLTLYGTVTIIGACILYGIFLATTFLLGFDSNTFVRGTIFTVCVAASFMVVVLPALEGS